MYISQVAQQERSYTHDGHSNLTTEARKLCDEVEQLNVILERLDRPDLAIQI